MFFPNYILVLLAVVIIFVVTIIVYFQIYKRHINKALDINNEQRSTMTPPYKITIIMSVFVLIIGILISYFAGYMNAYKDYEKNLWVMSPSDVQTFYAEMKEVSGDTISVEGISLNSEDYQGLLNYDFIEEQITIYQKDHVISVSDLSKDDLISITLLTDRSGSTSIFKIELLEEN